MYIYELFMIKGQPSREGLLAVAAFLVSLCFALVFHEVAHGLVAKWNGDYTAKSMGRLSLNPLRHFNLFGFAMMLLVGFGWANPVPVNPYNFKNKKVGAFTVSLAGIVTNLLLAFLFTLPCMLLGNIPVELGSSKYYVVYFFYNLSALMIQLNVSFALFNLLPLFPLDGYRLFACLIGENNNFMLFLRRYSHYIILGLLVIGWLPGFSNFSPLTFYIGNVGGLLQYAFRLFWGLFL